MAFFQDYMFHTKNDTEEEYELKQIEVNSGAVAGLLIQRVTEVHRRVLTKAQLPTTTEFLPENNPIGNVALGLYTAWKAFGNPNAIMVMVVSKIGSPNHYEQRLVEYELERISSGQMEVVRLRHTECAQRLHLAKDFTLMLGNRVVSVVYFRVSHLATKDYDGDTFEGRRMIDRSTAIKCPSIGMLLANTKKVQQALTMPGMLEHFFPLPEETKMIVAIRSTFADMWGLDKSDKKTRRVIKDAIAHPDRYVLKPNKEGGGNNFWGPDIADKLITMPHAELAKHILMQKLKPMVSQNYFIRPFLAPEFGPVVSELGVFGALVGNQVTGRVLYNRSQGHAMRTKWERVHEGGISCGSAVYDSPYLVV